MITNILFYLWLSIPIIVVVSTLYNFWSWDWNIHYIKGYCSAYGMWGLVAVIWFWFGLLNGYIFPQMWFGG